MTPWESGLRRLLSALSHPKGPSPNLFNPYRDEDPDLDRPGGAAIRRANLRAYLRCFRPARYLLVGEAAGYNGCRFSGLPFTGEDLIVGDRALPWTRDLPFARSSSGERLSSERSAAIVWEGIAQRRDLLLWNTVPWHPHQPHKPLSNRRPGRREVEQGLALLKVCLQLFPKATPVAVGRVAEGALRQLGYEAIYVRHPSMGGKRAFLSGVAELK
ncbi:MAG: uracil-DNA glycosylase [Planctomycetota bacterium]